MKYPSFVAMVGFALGTGLLMGCDSIESPSQTSASSSSSVPDAFDRDMLAIKATEKDPVRVETLVRELVVKHGFTPRSGQGPEVSGAGPAEPLAKAAAMDRWPVVKDYQDTITNSYENVIVVRAGDVLTITTERTPGTDPILAAYWIPSQITSANTINVVGLNDDFGGTLNSRISWTNNTGANRWIHYVAFAYNKNTWGRAKVTAITTQANVVQSAADVQVMGLLVRGNTAPSLPGNCYGPRLSRISGRVVDPRVDSRVKVLGINASAMIGALVQTSSTTFVTQTLNGVLPDGYPNFLLAYRGVSASLPGAGDGSKFQMTQADLYECL